MRKEQESRPINVCHGPERGIKMEQSRGLLTKWVSLGPYRLTIKEYRKKSLLYRPLKHADTADVKQWVSSDTSVEIRESQKPKTITTA